MKAVRITEDEFYEKFKPIKNHIDDNASFDGCMYETYDKEFEFVCQKNQTSPNHIWTIVDIDGDLVITNGLHFVNRMGYLITEVPFEDDVFYDVYDPIPETTEQIRSFNLLDIVGSYDDPEEIEECVWVQKNATYAHVSNGKSGLFEYILNMDVNYENIPDKLQPLFANAKDNNVAYLVFHQGT